MSNPLTRILFLDQTGQLGGAELSLLDIATHFRSRATVALFTDGPFLERLLDREVDVTLIPLGKHAANVRKNASCLTRLRAIPALIHQLRSIRKQAHGFDLAYANTPKAFVVAALALLRVPLIYHLRDTLDAAHFSPSNRRLLVRLANRRAAAVICNSQATHDAFLSAGGSSEKTIVIPNGIDPTPFRETGSEPSRLRQALSVPGAVVLGAFGRLAAWKGQHVAIEALAKLPKQVDVHLWIVGDAVFGEDDHTYAKHLHDLVHKLGVVDRVHFLGFRDDIPSLMSACDLVVHSATRAEPFGRVIVEAMLAGTPVIASRAGGPTEIIDEGITGHLSTPGDAEDLAKLIQEWLRNPEAAKAMAERAKKHAAKAYGLDSVLRLIEVAIEEVVENA